MVITMQPRFSRGQIRYDIALVFEQAHKKILPFVTQVQPDLKGLKNILAIGQLAFNAKPT